MVPRRVALVGTMAAKAILTLLVAAIGAAQGRDIGSDSNASVAAVEAWCHRTVPAQTGRLAALEQLLSTTQASTITVASTEGQKSQKEATSALLVQLAVTLETKRVSAEAAQDAQNRSLFAARLETAGASTEVQALQDALKRVGSDGRGAHALQQLLQAAILSEDQRKKQVQLLQTDTQSSQAAMEIVRIAGEYNATHAQLEQSSRWQSTSGRSLKVLTSALEKEAAYLAEVRALCSTATRVSERLRGHILPELQSSHRRKNGVQLKSPASSATAHVKKKTAPKAAAELAGPQIASPKVDANSKQAIPDSSPVEAAPAPEKNAVEPVRSTVAPAAVNMKADVVNEPSKHKIVVSQAAQKVTPAPPTQLGTDAGGMPSEYSAWRPDGEAPTHKQDEVEIKAGESATLKMKELLGEDGSADTGLSTATPAKLHVKASSTVISGRTKKKKRDLHQTPAPPVAEATIDEEADSPAPAPPAKPVASTQAPPSSGDESTGDEIPGAPPATATISSSQSTEPNTGDGAASGAPAGTTAHAVPRVSEDRSSIGKSFDADDAVDRAFPGPTPGAEDSSDDHADTQSASDASLDADFAPPPSPPAPHRHHGALVQEKVAGLKKQREESKTKAPTEEPQPPQDDSMPQGYAAWTPADDGKVKKDASLEQMVADFESDDDDDAPSPPKKHRSRHRQTESRKMRHQTHESRKAAKRKVEKTDDGDNDDNVVYDDDDLPLKRRHRVPLATELSGGWQSLMRQKKPKHPKVDPDVAIMQSLYANGGALPQQYAAWKPDDGQKHATTVAPAATAPQAADAEADDSSDADVSDKDGKDASADDDFQKAARSLKDDDDDDATSFVQVMTSNTRVHQGFAQKHTRQTGGALRGAQKAGSSQITAAVAALQSFAKALHSSALEDVAKAPLATERLTALSQKLKESEAKDGEQTKQAKVVKMCTYFQKHAATSTPLRKAVTQVEEAEDGVMKATALRNALHEEADARAQLQKTVDQDVQGVLRLLQAEKDMINASTALKPSEPAQALEDAHRELADAIEEVWRQRADVAEDQRGKLSQLALAAKDADADLSSKKTVLVQAQAALDTQRRKLEGIRSSCDAALLEIARRRHNLHAEAKAVEEVLQLMRADLPSQ